MKENTTHFSILLLQKLDIANTLNLKIQNKISIMYNVRSKRGIFNGIGIASKYLFGTMDSDDNEYINEYLYTLRKNEVQFKNSLSIQQTILVKLVNKYNMFSNMQTNQKQIIIHLNELLKRNER